MPINDNSFHINSHQSRIKNILIIAKQQDDQVILLDSSGSSYQFT